MKLFIFCTFLFFSGSCFGQISANGKDLKDLKDDYVVVYQLIPTVGSMSGKVFWVGAWGVDTTGYAKSLEMAAGKSMKTLTNEMDSEYKKMIETCQIKDEANKTLTFRYHVDVFNALSRCGFSYSFKEAPIVLGSYATTMYIFERRK